MAGNYRIGRTIMTGALCACLLPGCLLDATGTGKGSQEEREAQSLLEIGLTALSAGDHESAEQAFSELGLYQGYACESDYGLVLSAVLGLIADVDDLLDLYGLVAGEQKRSALTPAQGFNIDSVAENFLGPFEQRFAEIREPGQRAIQAKCVLDVPGAFPVRLGAPDAFFYLDAKIGYEFDASFVRAVLSGVEVVQALFDFVLAHRLQFNDDVQEAFDVVTDALSTLEESDEGVGSGAIDETERQTIISVVRAAGVLFDVDSGWLAFRNTTRMNDVDDDLERSFRLIFSRAEDGSESGILEDLFFRAAEDTAPTDNVLAILDHDRSGTLSDDDEILFGLRGLEYGFSGQVCDGGGSLFEVSELGFADGVKLRINDPDGRLAELVRLYKEFVQALGDQMQAVEDASVEWRRVGIADVNAMASYLMSDFDPIPEILEIDARAFFTNPVPVRELLPYWYDDPTDESALDVFLVEAEAAVTSTAEPFLAGEDVAHFAVTVTFGTLGDLSPETLDAEIPADGIFGPDAGWELLPYIGWQSPSFHGLLYLNTQALPVAPEGENSFAEADLYTVNKATQAMLVYYVDDIEASVEASADVAADGELTEFCE